ncbi:MAG: hypothetical protein IT365_11970 [Candidatus Hydrogenedentes bacterium]|nr:hypothetical protein [Candidatus Hydrogenedentota bacterium]
MFFPNEGRQPSCDATLMAWNIWYSTECVLDFHSPLHTDLWLWPDGTSLGRHMLAPGFFPIGMAAKLVMGNSILYPFYAHRAAIFGSFVLLFALMYILLRRLSCLPVPAAIVSCAFSYSDFFMGHAHYINFLAMFLFPLAALLLLRFCQTPSFWPMFLLAITIAGSVYFTEMGAFGVVALVLLLAILLATQRGREEVWRILSATRFWWWMVSAATAVIIAAPFLWAYAHVREVSLYESSRELSASITGLFIPHRLFNPLIADFIRSVSGLEYDGTLLCVWLGIVIPSLAAVSPLVLAKSIHMRLLWPLLTVAVIFLILSLGPDLTAGEMTYPDVLPYYSLSNIPPFASFRAPGRLVSVALFLMAIPAGLSLSRLSTRGRTGRGILAVCCGLVALESYVPDSHVARSELSGWSLRNVFATPSRDFVELVSTRCQPGACATLPPSFYDTAGVFAQLIHHQPVFAGCWMSRWSERQQDAYIQFHETYWYACHQQDPAMLAVHLKERGVKNVLLTKTDKLSDEFVSDLSDMINVIDAREYYTSEFEPFVHAIPQH